MIGACRAEQRTDPAATNALIRKEDRQETFYPHCAHRIHKISQQLDEMCITLADVVARAPMASPGHTALFVELEWRASAKREYGGAALEAIPLPRFHIQ